MAVDLISFQDRHPPPFLFLHHKHGQDSNLMSFQILQRLGFRLPCSS